MTTYIPVLFVISIIVLVLCTLYAIISVKTSSKESKYDSTFHESSSLSAMNRTLSNSTNNSLCLNKPLRVSTGLLTWTMYTTLCGSWILYTPSSFALTNELIGCLSYSMACLFPLLVQSFLTSKIKKLYPEAQGITDYFRFRYGIVSWWYVRLVLFFCLGVNLAAEYTAIVGLYNTATNSVEGKWIGMAIMVTTYAYTIYGGLQASVSTDKVQGILGLFIQLVIMAYLAFNIKHMVSKIKFNDVKDKIVNRSGIESIVSLPIQLTSLSLFFNSAWQRTWIAADTKTLNKSCLLASIMGCISVLFFGLIGLVSDWSGLNPNCKNMVVLNLLSNLNINLKPYVVVVVCVLALVLTQSTADNLQTAILDMFNTVFQSSGFVSIQPNVKTIRLCSCLCLLLIDLITFVLSLLQKNLLDLYLLSNLVCVISVPALILGIFPKLNNLLTQASSLFGCISGFISLILYGLILKDYNLKEGLKYVFMENYGYDTSLIALFSPILGIVVFCLIYKSIALLKNETGPEYIN